MAIDEADRQQLQVARDSYGILKQMMDQLQTIILRGNTLTLTIKIDPATLAALAALITGIGPDTVARFEKLHQDMVAHTESLKAAVASAPKV